MDFLDPEKKRAHRTRLFIGYGLMAVVLGIATYLLAAVSFGYWYDRKTGKVIQNGTIIVDAHPEAANVFVNGVGKGTTNNRLVMPAGNYTIRLQRDGYNDWQHSVSLEGGSIEQLVYPFIFPSKLVTKTLTSYAAPPPSMAFESPDRHWLVVSEPGSASTFDIFDLNDTKNPKTVVALPADVFNATPGAHAYEAVEWSTDNTHLLLKHSYTGGAEFIVLDRAHPENSLNLTKLFPSQPFTVANLRDKKPDQLYLFNGTTGDLFTADSKAKTATLLISHVLSYKTYQANTVLYTTNPTNNTTGVEVHVRQSDQDYLLRALPPAPTYLMDMADFNGHFYLVAGSTADGRVYLYRDPFDDLTRKPSRMPEPFRVLIVPNAQFVSFSAIARFVAVQGGSAFAVYDSETGRQFRYDTKLVLDANEKANWMDGHRLTLVSGGKVHIFDFDNANSRALAPSAVQFMPFFDRDYKALFTLAPDSKATDKTDVIRTELKVLPPGQNP